MAGSRDPHGNVSSVHWNPNYRKVKVDNWSPDNSNENVRARQEVLSLASRYFIHPFVILEISCN